MRATNITRWRLSLLATWFTLAFAAPAQATFSIKAAIDPATMTLDDEATLKLTVTSDSGGRVPIPLKPKVTGLSFIENPSLSEHRAVSRPGGGIETVKVFAYDVIAEDEGVYDIPGFKIIVGGTEYKSNGVRLQVGRQAYSSTPNVGNTPQPSPYGWPTPQPIPPDNTTKTNDDSRLPPYWIRATVDKKEVTKSQQILFTFRLFTQENIDLGEFMMPTLDDFWLEELVKEKRGSATVNGQQYATLEKSYALFPLKSGKLTIGETQLKIQIVVYDNTVSNWGPLVFRGGKTRQITKTLKSDPIEITVSDLPAPVPRDFTGLVGNFDVRARLKPEEVAVGKSLTLDVELSGQGNIMDAVAPTFHIPGVKVYEDKPMLDLMTSSAGVSGTKSFKMRLIPAKAGGYTLPPLSLSYYDPNLRQYVQMDVAELKFAVIGGTQGTTDTLLSATEPYLNDEKKLLLIADPAVAFIAAPKPFSDSFLALLASLPPLLVAVMTLARRKKAPKRQTSRQRVRRAARGFRSKVRAAGQDPERLLGAMRKFLAEGFEAGSITAVEAQGCLTVNGVEKKAAESFRKHMEALEAARYGQGDDVEKTEGFLRLIDEVLKSL